MENALEIYDGKMWDSETLANIANAPGDDPVTFYPSNTPA